MATALDTVEDYITDVRTMLQDVVSPYRYENDELLVAFNVTLLEARRIRADLFVYNPRDKYPNYQAVNDEQVCIEPPFRLAIVFGTAAHALARDQEDIQDVRASQFMKVFNDLLTGSKMGPLARPQNYNATRQNAASNQ